jgi:acetyltransferase
VTFSQDSSRDLPIGGRRPIRLRALRPVDRDIYERAVVDLSPRSRYLRFLSPIDRPSERVLDQMTRVDGHDHVAFIALLPEEATGVGVVRYVRVADVPSEAEVAIAIADDWQGRGLGRELMLQTIEHAQEAGVSALLSTTLCENGGSLGLLETLGFSAAGRTGPYVAHRMNLPPSTALL